MKFSDPSGYKVAEQRMLEHVQRLLADDRLRLDTRHGTRAVTALKQTNAVDTETGALALRRTMADMGLPDRELEAKMPTSPSVEAVFTAKKFWFFTERVGRFRLVTASPTRALLDGSDPAPMTSAEASKLIADATKSAGTEPVTVVLLATAGLEPGARELATRTTGKTVVLVEPNDSGGFTIHGPLETKALNDLLDPESAEDKSRRVKQYLDANRAELLMSGVSADKVAARTQLPLQFVDSELKSWAKNNPGFLSKRMDGRLVVYREGQSAPLAGSPASGDSQMPLFDRMKNLFSRKGENEKKVAFLSEKRASLSQQRERAYEEMASLEEQEGLLKKQFGDANSALTKKRITSQMLTLRKDIERRQQLLNVLNQQINVVSTHLHTLELVQQGTGAKLPDSDEIAADAAKAEEMLAGLEADAELVTGLTPASTSGLTEEEAALFAELEAETGNKAAEKPAAEKAAPQSTSPIRTPAAPAAPASAPAAKTPPQRNTPEAG